MRRITKLQMLVLLEKANGIPAYKQAAAIGIHPSIFSRYISGKQDIRQPDLAPICEYFDVTPEQVLGWEEVDV